MERKEIILQKIDECNSSAEIMQVLADNDIHITSDQLQSMMLGQVELSDSDLEHVNGGVGIVDFAVGLLAPIIKGFIAEKIDDSPVSKFVKGK